MKLNFLIVVTFLSIQPLNVWAQGGGCGLFGSVAGFKDQASIRTFLTGLKASKNAESLLKYVKFPLKVNTNPTPMIVKDSSEFKAKFNEIYTAKFQKEIANSKDTDAYCNPDGLMFGHGTIWVKNIGGSPGVFAINP